MSEFMDKLKAIAATDKKTVVLAEGEDLRTIQAADQILKEGFADLIILGDEAKIAELAKDYEISAAKVIDPAKSELTADSSTWM